MRSAGRSLSRAATVAALVVAGSLSPAFAQVESGLEVDPYAGAFRASGGTVRTIDARRGRFIRTAIDEDGVTVGLRAGYNLNARAGVEASFVWATNHYVAGLHDLGATVSTTDNNALIFLMGNGLFYLLRGRVVPYVTAGAGVLGTIEQASPAFNYGMGLKAFVSTRVAVRLDARQYRANLSDALEQTVPSRDGLVSVLEPYKETLRFVEVSVGLGIFF